MEKERIDHAKRTGCWRGSVFGKVQRSAQYRDTKSGYYDSLNAKKEEVHIIGKKKMNAGENQGSSM